MAKVKKTKKADTFIDMTAMSDVTVLLLTFFMLSATFKPLEPIEVIAPGSVSETQIPEHHVMTILVDPEGRAFVNIDRDEDKLPTLEQLTKRRKVVELTSAQRRSFMEATHIGSSIEELPRILDMTHGEQYKEMVELGVPMDSLNNQLADWIWAYSQVKGKEGKFAVKADQDTPYEKVNKVMTTLVDEDQNQYSLITTLKTMPEGL